MAVTACLKAGGFNLTAFASSLAGIINTVTPQRRSASVLDLNLDTLPVEYHLGLELDLKTNTYKVRTKPMPLTLTFGICLPVITGAKFIFKDSKK